MIATIVSTALGSVILYNALGLPSFAKQDYVDQELLKRDWRIQSMERTIDRAWRDTLINRRITLRDKEFTLEEKIKASDNDETIRAYREKLGETRDDLNDVNSKIKFLDQQIQDSMRRF